MGRRRGWARRQGVPHRRRDQPIAGGPRPSVSRQCRCGARQQGGCVRAPKNGSGRQSRASPPGKRISRPSSSSPSASSICSDLMPESSSRLLRNDSPATEHSRVEAARLAARISRIPTTIVDRASAATIRFRSREHIVGTDRGISPARIILRGGGPNQSQWGRATRTRQRGCRDRKETAWAKERPGPRFAAGRAGPPPVGRL